MHSEKRNRRKLTAIMTVSVALAIAVTFMPTISFALPVEVPADTSSAGYENIDMNPSGGCVPKDTSFELITPEDVAKNQPAGNASGKKRLLRRSAGQATMPLLVIVVGFKDDIKYNDSYDWSKTIFSDNKNDWSLAKYYSDNSQGRFTFVPAVESSAYDGEVNTNSKDVVNDGVVHVNVNMDHGIWVEQWKEGHEGPDRDSWRDALDAAMKQADKYVDYAQYDSDGDGEIETNEMALGFVIAGGEGSSLSEYKEIISWRHLTWAHAWKMSAFMDKAPVCDGVTLDRYIAIGENTSYFPAKKQAGIGTLAHELGHYLGLPDYYDTKYDKTGAWGHYEVNRISIMANGNWCMVDDDYRPCAFDACSRVRLGWAEPVTAAPGNTYTINAHNYDNNTGYTVLKIPTGNEGEYYLVENRQFAGWDEGLRSQYPAADNKDKEIRGSYAENGGLVFWHIDDGIISRYWNNDFNDLINSINTSDHRPGCMPVFMEYDKSTDFRFIGSKVDTKKLFYDGNIYKTRYAATAGHTIFLPTYNREKDIPSARIQKKCVKGITLQGSGPSIKLKYADGHSWDGGKVTKAATCISSGTRTYTCLDESTHTKTESIPATGKHKWSAWKASKKATVYAAGVETRKCTYCSKTETRSIPKLKVSGLLMATATASGTTSLNISWTKVQNADGYDIFFAKCNVGKEKNNCRKIKTISGNKTFKWKKTKLARKTAYKMYVKAFTLKSGRKTYVRTSPTVHVFTGGYKGNYTNPKAVRVKKTSVAIKKGKTYKIKASVTKLKAGKKLPKDHGKSLRYISTNTKVATVSSSGKIKGVGKGRCKVYAYAINGVRKAVNVTVK